MIEDLKNWQQLTLFQCQQWHTANWQQVTMVTGPVNIPAQIMSSHSMEHSSWSPCVVPIHRASVIHCVCVCPPTKEERCVCVWKKCQFCVDYESSGLSLCKSRIYFRTVTYILLWFLSVYMCCVIHRLCLIMWCLHCSGSKSHCNHSSLLRCKTRSSLVKSNHKQIPKTGGAAFQDSVGAYHRD